MSFFFFPKISLASFDFTLNKVVILEDEEIEANINLSLQGQNNKSYFLEAAFKKEGESNYFGQTWNDSSWTPYTSSNFTSLKQVNTDSTGNWSGLLKAKLDTSNSNFKGEGNYIFQLKRFTTSGSSSWSDNSQTLLVITLNNSPSPTPQPSSSSPTSSQSKFEISSIQSLKSSEDLIVHTQITNLSPNTKYYLKASFFKEGSTNYFGKTLVSNSWVKNAQTYSSQLPIATDSSGNWNSDIKVMVDTQDSGFTDSGKYNLKIGRYTSLGSGPTWSNTISIDIQNDSPSPEHLTDNSAVLSSSKSLSSSNMPLPNSSSQASSSSSSIYPITYYNPNLTKAAEQSTSPPTLNSKPKFLQANFFEIGGGICFFLLSIYALFKMLKER